MNIIAPIIGLLGFVLGWGLHALLGSSVTLDIQLPGVLSCAIIFALGVMSRHWLAVDLLGAVGNKYRGRR